MTYYVGIDPGKAGYLAIVDGAGAFKDVRPVPLIGKAYDLPAMLSLVRRVPADAFVALEKQQPMPRDGCKQSFGTGFGYGLWRMALTAAGLSYEEVRPAAWKGKMGLMVGTGLSKPEQAKARKAAAVVRCQNLFPGVSLLRTPKCRVPSHDMAEALLLARYAHRLAQGLPL